VASRVITWQPGTDITVVISTSGRNLLVAVGGTIVAGVVGFAIGIGTSFAESSPGVFMALLIGGAVAVGLALMRVAGARSNRRVTLTWTDRTVRMRSRAGVRAWPFADIEAVIVEKEIIHSQHDMIHKTDTVVRMFLSVPGQRFLLDDGLENEGVSKRAHDLATALGVPLR